MLEQLKARYERYCREYDEVLRKKSPADGLFGFGNDPKKHHCHDSFYEDVAAWVREFEANDPAAPEAEAAVDYILRAPERHRDGEVFWYMYAAQKHAAELIARMGPAACGELAAWYNEAYPRLDRMPVQKDIYKRLRKGAKARK